MVPVGCLQPGKNCYNLGLIPWNPLSSPHERGSQLNFSWGPFTPPVIYFMQDFFLLRYCKAEVNEYSNSSLGLDLTPPPSYGQGFCKGEQLRRISYFSHSSDQIAGKKQLKGSLSGPICFEGFWPCTAGKAWWQVAPAWWEHDIGTPHPFICLRETENRSPLQTSRSPSTHSKPLPPAKLHLPKVPQSPKRVSPAGGQVLKHISPWRMFHIQSIT